MQTDHQIIAQVYSAKDDINEANELIKAYIPFIRTEASKFLSRICTEQDDEFSIAMIAFHEAINSYTKIRGAFLKYASLIIKSRLIDYQRKEARHKGHISLDDDTDDNNASLYEQLADDKDCYSESDKLNATKQEIEELSAVMSNFGISLTDVTEHSPKQARTLEACARAVRYAKENPELLDELLKTKKLPLAQLVEGSKVERKTLERHRKYILAMLLIQTNGYEIIRGHLKHVLEVKEGAVK